MLQLAKQRFIKWFFASKATDNATGKATGDAKQEKAIADNTTKPIKLDKDRLLINRLTQFVTNSKSSDLSMHRVYILPSLKGIYYAITIVVMFVWSINYALSLGYAMTFFVMVFALILAVFTVKNLSRIHIKPVENVAYFAGEAAFFKLSVENASDAIAIAIKARRNGLLSDAVSVKPNHQETLLVPLDDNTRGRKKLTYVRISSDYPIGIFYSWVWLHFEQTLMIYPKPEGDIPLTRLLHDSGTHSGGASEAGIEDFYQLSDYQAGDNIRHLVWKRVGLGQLQVKRFQSESGKDCLLDFNDALLYGLPLEAKLSQLCQWALEAEKQGIRYGLVLPNERIKPGTGIAHQRRVLEALACF